MKDVVDYMPTDRLLLETDCPYPAPEPFSGRRNSSYLLPYVVRTVAEIKGIPQEEVERISWGKRPAVLPHRSERTELSPAERILPHAGQSRTSFPARVERTVLSKSI